VQDPEEEDLDAMDLWREVVEEVLAGRTEDLACPACREGMLTCRFDGDSLELRCPRCGRHLQAMLA